MLLVYKCQIAKKEKKKFRPDENIYSVCIAES